MAPNTTFLVPSIANFVNHIHLFLTKEARFILVVAKHRRESKLVFIFCEGLLGCDAV
jgi:hypothetical protein